MVWVEVMTWCGVVGILVVVETILCVELGGMIVLDKGVVIIVVYMTPVDGGIVGVPVSKPGPKIK